MSLHLHLCENFSIKQILLGWAKKKKKEKYSLVEKHLIIYEELIPIDEDYMYLKVLKNEIIISLNGNLMNFFNIKKNTYINKKISKIKKDNELVDEYLFPLFVDCIEDGEIYQFVVKFNDDELYSCTLYPCFLNSLDISSVDIIVRKYKHTMDKDKFKLIKLN